MDYEEADPRRFFETMIDLFDSEGWKYYRHYQGQTLNMLRGQLEESSPQDLATNLGKVQAIKVMNGYETVMRNNFDQFESGELTFGDDDE